MFFRIKWVKYGLYMIKYKQGKMCLGMWEFFINCYVDGYYVIIVLVLGLDEIF